MARCDFPFGCSNCDCGASGPPDAQVGAYWGAVGGDTQGRKMVPAAGCAAEDSLWPVYTGGVDDSVSDAGPRGHDGPLKRAKYVDLTHACIPSRHSPRDPSDPGSLSRI
jgi:hypothetical protein